MKKAFLTTLVALTAACSGGERTDARGSESLQPHETTTISTTTTAAPEQPAAPAPSATTTESSHGAADPQRGAIALAATVLPAASFKDPSVQATYRKAKDVADRLDQMYCYCHCKEGKLKHKSLLTCFQSRHAAACGICLHEAELAHADWKRGVPLAATIKTVDLMYKSTPAMHH